MYRKLPWLFLIPSLACAVLVTADFFGVFGIHQQHETVLHELYLQPRNSLDNSPVDGVVTRCFQQGNRNACSQKDTQTPGLVALKFSGTKIKRRSFLFDQGERIAPSKDPKIQVMLIHPDFMTRVETIDIPTYLDNTEKKYVVRMQARGEDVTAVDQDLRDN